MTDSVPDQPPQALKGVFIELVQYQANQDLDLQNVVDLVDRLGVALERLEAFYPELEEWRQEAFLWLCRRDPRAALELIRDGDFRFGNIRPKTRQQLLQIENPQLRREAIRVLGEHPGANPEQPDPPHDPNEPAPRSR